MSLINVRNFLAPFRNKYQIGALLVLALVVAVVRLISTSEPTPDRENLKLNGQIKDFLASQQPVTQANKDRLGASRSNDEAIGGLLEDGWAKEEVAEAPAAPPVDSGATQGLSDIKKSLGLE
jgi:hypothetical protein